MQKDKLRKQGEVCPLAWFLQVEGMGCLPQDTGSSPQSGVVFICVSARQSAPSGDKSADSRRFCPCHLSNPWYTSSGFCKYPGLVWWDHWGKEMSEFYRTAVDITVDVACARIVCLSNECSSLDSFLIQSTVSRPAIMQRLVPEHQLSQRLHCPKIPSHCHEHECVRNTALDKKSSLSKAWSRLPWINVQPLTFILRAYLYGSSVAQGQ